MTYSRKSDIPLPYGQLKRTNKETEGNKNYVAIAKSKSKDAIWVVSHCITDSRREEYVSILKQYISVDVLGACGRRRRHNHDFGNCFSILNTTYRYNLAFENAICEDYITEKFFENYDYDIIQVVRGGDLKTRPINISVDAYISASDFTNAHELGKFLKGLSENPLHYANMLREKDKYRLVHYRQLFKHSVCEICKRLHNLEDYYNVYENVESWIHENEICIKPTDI